MPLLSISELVIRPEKVGEFEDIIARVAERAHAEPSALEWALFEVTSGEFGTYRVIIQTESWEGVGALTSLEPAIELFGSAQAPLLIAQMRGCFASARQLVVQTRPELSCIPQRSVGEWRLPITELTQLRALPGSQEVIETYLRRLTEAIRKTGDPRRFMATESIVGDLFEYSMATPVSTLGELDSFLSPAELLTEAFGEVEGGRLREASLSALAGADRQILVMRPDLSNES